MGWFSRRRHPGGRHSRPHRPIGAPGPSAAVAAAAVQVPIDPPVRTERRSVPPADPVPAQPPAPARPGLLERTVPEPPTVPERPTGPVRPDGEVRLAYADGSALTLHPDDPRAQAFRAIARELARPD